MMDEGSEDVHILLGRTHGTCPPEAIYNESSCYTVNCVLEYGDLERVACEIAAYASVSIIWVHEESHMIAPYHSRKHRGSLIPFNPLHFPVNRIPGRRSSRVPVGFPAGAALASVVRIIIE